MLIIFQYLNHWLCFKGKSEITTFLKQMFHWNVAFIGWYNVCFSDNIKNNGRPWKGLFQTCSDLWLYVLPEIE